MIQDNLCRNEVNKRIGRVCRCFKWAVENELVPGAVTHALDAVAGLKKGRTEARESPKVETVPIEYVHAVKPFVSRQVWAMIELQVLSGMRPGEATILRTADLDMSGEEWEYRPSSHKTEHHDRERIVYFGPQAQEVLKPWLKADPAAFLFSPRDVADEKSAARRKSRQSPLTPSQRARGKKVQPGRAPRERYDTHSYMVAIRRACTKANVPNWHPHQLRHNAATRYEKEFSADISRALLGLSTPAMARVYAEQDFDKARAAMKKIG